MEGMGVWGPLCSLWKAACGLRPAAPAPCPHSAPALAAPDSFLSRAGEGFPWGRGAIH